MFHDIYIVSYIFVLIKRNIILLEGLGAAGDACKGDSGGPATMENKKTKKHVLVGVVSWGEGCARKNTYGVYVKLYNFLAWVNSLLD